MARWRPSGRKNKSGHSAGGDRRSRKYKKRLEDEKGKQQNAVEPPKWTDHPVCEKKSKNRKECLQKCSITRQCPKGEMCLHLVSLTLHPTIGMSAMTLHVLQIMKPKCTTEGRLCVWFPFCPKQVWACGGNNFSNCKFVNEVVFQFNVFHTKYLHQNNKQVTTNFSIPSCLVCCGIECKRFDRPSKRQNIPNLV